MKDGHCASEGAEARTNFGPFRISIRSHCSNTMVPAYSLYLEPIEEADSSSRSRFRA
jgi:hypothetical protein